MRFSLKTKVSILLTLIIIVISTVSTYLFTSAHGRSSEKSLIARGTALSYSLSKAAEEGLLHEDLDLIKRASNIVKAPDVILAQVFTDIWEAVDAYPFERMKEAAHPDAVMHFKNQLSPLNMKLKNGYDFYSPILFRVTEDSPPVSIGFVRIELSSSAIQGEQKRMVVTNVAVSVVLTLLAILSLNLLIGRLVVKPVMSLYKSVSMFKNGALPDDSAVPRESADEIGELWQEFNQMCRTIKEKENRLVESEGRIKSLFDRVEHAIFRLGSNGDIIQTNPRFNEMFGDVHSLCEILMGDKNASDCLQRAGSERTVQREEKAVGAHGEELTVLLSLYAETAQNGEINGFDGYIIDITEKKRLEERLLRSQKLEAVGTLAGGIAHDFNNLLTAIIGYSEIMLEKIREDDPLRKHAEIIHGAAERGAELTKRILTLTRKEKVETKLLDINEIIRSSLELLKRSIPKHIEIVTNLRKELPKVKADAAQVQQVILNLAVNARDAMPHEGRLTIETDSDTAGDGVSNPVVAEKSGFIKVSVSDTGTGMDKGTQGRIFDPFFTTKETGKGTGLGLYMVHSIVTHHGGYINLYSEPGRGTRFNIYLPVALDAESIAPDEISELRGTETILVVDDEAYVREMCRDILAPLGYEVLLAEGGSDCIDIFSRHRERISIIVLDMIMPKMGGNQVFQAVRAIKSDVKVLLCSGYSSNGFAGIDKLLRGGANGFIQKPFSRQDIALAIRKALSE